MRWKTSLFGAALSGAVLLGGITLVSTTAQARDRDRGCRDVSREERELQRNIGRHGFFSPQAERDRRELRRLRASCGGDNRGFFRNGRHRHQGDGDHDRDDRFFFRNGHRRHGDGDHDRDDRWRGRGHDRDHDGDRH